MWSRLTYPRKKKKCIIVPLVGRPTMNQSSQVFKGYVNWIFIRYINSNRQ